MSGETDLSRLLASLQPALDPASYTFVSLAENLLPKLVRPLGLFRETEGISAILPLHEAHALALPARGEFRRLTLHVHSSLAAVGLTAAVARTLAEAGIACNCVAAAHHDHLFIPADRADEALALLQRLQQTTAAAHAAPVRYRRAAADDAAAIAALGATVWITTYCVEAVPREYAEYVLGEFTQAKIAAALATPGTVFWVAEAAEGLLAFADLRLGERTPELASAGQAEVARLYVLERFARRGLGRALLERCRATAAASGATDLWLSMYSGNERARTFYRALGWKKVGDLAFTLGARTYPNDVLASAIPPAGPP